MKTGQDRVCLPFSTPVERPLIWNIKEHWFAVTSSSYTQLFTYMRAVATGGTGWGQRTNLKPKQVWAWWFLTHLKCSRIGVKRDDSSLAGLGCALVSWRHILQQHGWGCGSVINTTMESFRLAKPSKLIQSTIPQSTARPTSHPVFPETPMLPQAACSRVWQPFPWRNFP